MSRSSSACGGRPSGGKEEKVRLHDSDVARQWPGLISRQSSLGCLESCRCLRLPSVSSLHRQGSSSQIGWFNRLNPFLDEQPTRSVKLKAVGCTVDAEDLNTTHRSDRIELHSNVRLEESECVEYWPKRMGIDIYSV